MTDTREERSALFAIFIISALASAITFLIPLYVQVVQGRSSFATALAVIPFSIGSFIAAVLVVRLYERLSPSRIARNAFLIVAVGLRAARRHDSQRLERRHGDAEHGHGRPRRRRAGDAAVQRVGLRFAQASRRRRRLGARSDQQPCDGRRHGARAGALVIGLLGTSVHQNLVHNARIPTELKVQMNLDDVSFISNDRLRRSMESTTATPEAGDRSREHQHQARLLALKLTLFTFAGIALLAYFPAGSLPRYERKTLPSHQADDLAGATPHRSAKSSASPA